MYSLAYVFVNPTYEDNYPTTNLEASACGTPVISYITGGSVESVPNDNCVKQGDLDGIVKKIGETLCINSSIMSDSEVVQKYIDLYVEKN